MNIYLFLQNRSYAFAARSFLLLEIMLCWTRTLPRSGIKVFPASTAERCVRQFNLFDALKQKY